MDLDVRDRAYICVGGSRGMGFQTARVLAREGACVGIISSNPGDAAQRLREEFPVRIEAFAADGVKPGEIEAAIGQAIEAFGVVRGLLITSGQTENNGGLEATDDQWRANFEDVLMGTVRACRAVVPHMVENGGGQIVTSGAYSVRAAKAFLYPYAALKSAIVNFTKNLAKTYGADGVRANCVCPGAFENIRTTPRIEEIAAAENLSHVDASKVLLRDRFGMKVALERIGQPEEIADLMAFLLSERAAYLTGAIINMDGGTDF
jgi:NAD(P)-dependent dehydrogenase (short-subunit alcohol dehydrogenase family)